MWCATALQQGTLHGLRKKYISLYFCCAAAPAKPRQRGLLQGGMVIAMESTTTSFRNPEMPKMTMAFHDNDPDQE